MKVISSVFLECLRCRMWVMWSVATDHVCALKETTETDLDRQLRETDVDDNHAEDLKENDSRSSVGRLGSSGYIKCLPEETGLTPGETYR